KKDWIKILGLGLLIVLLNQVLYLWGQAYTSAGHGAMLFAFTPVFIYVFSMIFRKERLLAKRLIGTLLAVVGALIIVSQRGLDFSSDMLFGDFLIFIAVAVWGLYTVLGKPLAERYGALRVTAYAISLGSLAYAPYGLYVSSSFDIMSVSLTAWFSVFYMAAGVSVVVYALWYWALRHAEASRIGVFHNIQPLVAAFAGYFMLGEVVTSGFIIGGSIVLCGVIVVEWK
ncbi:MAG: EamA family transporter, partial [candidate division Zixibacteria bacterium]|nr:EamA family transporter [candidate division Zixibacteria bacterium]